MSIRLGKESYENDNSWINDGDIAFGAICLALSPSLRYLIGSAEYGKGYLDKIGQNLWQAQ